MDLILDSAYAAIEMPLLSIIRQWLNNRVLKYYMFEIFELSYQTVIF
jgi:hypothetical protein